MGWDFETEPEFQEKLDWVDRFVRDEVEPLDIVLDDLEFTPPDARVRAIIDPLKQQVRDQGLWACHLGPELGGTGIAAFGTRRSTQSNCGVLSAGRSTMQTCTADLSCISSVRTDSVNPTMACFEPQ